MSDHRPVESIYRAAPAVAHQELPLLPADLGFSSLGLWMQYTGWLFGGLWLAVAFYALFTAKGGSAVGLVLVVCALCAGRSVWGALVGVKLANAAPRGIRALRVFAFVAVLQALLMMLTALFVDGDAHLSRYGWLLSLLAAWPLCLLHLSGRRAARVLAEDVEKRAALRARDVPRVDGAAAQAPPHGLETRNFGIEGLGALMILFAGIGLLVLAAFLYFLIRANVPNWYVGIGVFAILLFGARGVAHFSAGIAAYRESKSNPLDSASARIAAVEVAVERYSKIVFASNGVLLFALLIAVTLMSGGVMLVAVALAGPLVMWPRAVRAYVARVRSELSTTPGSATTSSATTSTDATSTDTTSTDSVQPGERGEPRLLPSEDAGLGAIGFVLMSVGALLFPINGLLRPAEGAGGVSLPLLLSGWGGWATALVALWGGASLAVGARASRRAALAYALTTPLLAVASIVKLIDQIGSLPKLHGDLFMTFPTFEVAIVFLALPALVGALAVRDKRQRNAPSSSARPRQKA